MGSCVRFGTPSITFETGTPCQWTDVCADRPFCSETPITSPSEARIAGPGNASSYSQLSGETPDGEFGPAAPGVNSTVVSGGPDGGSRGATFRGSVPGKPSASGRASATVVHPASPSMLPAPRICRARRREIRVSSSFISSFLDESGQGEFSSWTLSKGPSVPVPESSGTPRTSFRRYRLERIVSVSFPWPPRPGSSHRPRSCRSRGNPKGRTR